MESPSASASASAPTEVESKQAVIDGAADPGDPTTGALWIHQLDGTAQFCTGIAIGPQSFLTAAHCLDNVVPSSTVFVVFGDSAFAPADGGGGDVSDGSLLDNVDDVAQAPGYRGDLAPTASHERDLAMVHLVSPVAGPFPPVDRYPLDRLGLFGKPLRLVGFGRSSVDNNVAGPKLQTTKTDYRVATDTEIEAGPNDGLGCRGDSGGPVFLDTPAGSSAIAAVDSRGDSACKQIDIATRVDAELTFIANFMAAHSDAPSCGADGRCGFGCTSPDPDCPCEADGLCTSACPTPAADPDCPQSCLFDGGRCAPPDPPLSSGCGCTASSNANANANASEIFGVGCALLMLSRRPRNKELRG